VLARRNRIVEGEELRHVSRRGQKFRSPLFTAAWVVSAEDSPARFGFITSKQVGGAVTRNLVKRRLRALAARTVEDHPHGYDLVVRAQAESSGASFDQLSQHWERMVSQMAGSA
jgi:ribonuclease P protein component